MSSSSEVVPTLITEVQQFEVLTASVLSQLSDMEPTQPVFVAIVRNVIAALESEPEALQMLKEKLCASGVVVE